MAPEVRRREEVMYYFPDEDDETCLTIPDDIKDFACGGLLGCVTGFVGFGIIADETLNPWLRGITRIGLTALAVLAGCIAASPTQYD